MKISSYYLCDVCDRTIKDFGLAVWCGWTLKYTSKKVMYDYHGKGGKRYDEPTDVCEFYEPRRGD